MKELKSGLRFGRSPDRVHRSIALPVLAYLTLVWINGRTPTTVRNFSISYLNQLFTEDVLREHAERSETRWRRRLETAKLAA
jgi:hypothetical protein